MLKRTLLVTVALLALSVSGAAADVTFKYISAADAAKMMATRETAKEADNLATSDGFRMAFKIRNKPGTVELNATQDVTMVIQEGDVLINYGGTAVNERQTVPGQSVADSIAGGKSVVMHAGDIVTVPANMPHEMLIQTPTMRYILFKTKASPEVTYKYIAAADAAKMVFDPARAKEAGTVASGAAYHMSLAKRTETGHVERHSAWDEELVIQEGDVLFNYGGTAVNAKQVAAGEWRGDSITGGNSHMLHAGDVVIIPADTWHEEVIKTPTMRYILFKTRK